MSERRLIIMRHAKSSWDDPDQDDHARPLARRGRLAAPLMGAFLAEIAAAEGFALDQVWLSDSLRTRQTYDAMRPLLAGAPDATLAPRLYTEDAGAIGLVLAQTPAIKRAVLCIGHHPALDGFVAELVVNPPEKFATAAMAILRLRVPWTELAAPRRGDATLAHFEAPKTLV